MTNDNAPVAICGDTTTMFTDGGPVSCERPRLHGGEHAHIAAEPNEYGHIAVRAWRTGGGSGWHVGADEAIRYCSTCAAPTPFDTSDGLCVPCRCDAKWLEGYRAGNVFVANGRAMQRTSQSGAFGDAMLTVTLDNGTVYGPDSKTWELGDVSTLVRPQMPDNATLQWGTR